MLAPPFSRAELLSDARRSLREARALAAEGLPAMAAQQIERARRLRAEARALGADRDALRFAALEVAWRAVERAAAGQDPLPQDPPARSRLVGDRWRFLRHQVDEWQAFKGAWTSGTRDRGRLLGAEIDAHVVFRHLQDLGHLPTKGGR